MDKKVYQSKKNYGKKYNMENITVQLNRNLINKLREKEGVTSIKEFLENLIKKEI